VPVPSFTGQGIVLSFELIAGLGSQMASQVEHGNVLILFFEVLHPELVERESFGQRRCLVVV
jgi:hypothetical protein